MVRYFDALKDTITQNHGGGSRFASIVPVKEIFDGKIAWEGDVMVFSLPDNPKAKRCYAWGHRDGKGDWEITTILETPPIDSAAAAVKAAIAASGAKR
jgi:hypothetical protein